MTPFVHDPERDAADVIRGFLYQVYLTVRRWIALRAGEVLYLECGEDIDVVAKALSTGEETRFLEQVKSREASVTLRSRATLEAVANFALHRERNPDHTLLFRFTTNATAGREQKVQFRGGATGIQIWSQLRGEGLSQTEREEIGDELRTFYRGLDKAPDISDDAWSALRRIVHDAPQKDWLDFIHSFEWSVGNVEPAAIGAALRRDLVESGVSQDEREAAEHEERLFFHVIHLSATEGEKRLSSADLQPALESGRDAVTQHRIADALNRLLRIEERVDVVEPRVDALDTRVTLLEAVASSSSSAISAAVAAHLKWSHDTYETFHSVALARRLPSSIAWNHVRVKMDQDRGGKDDTAENVLSRARLLLLSGVAGAGKSTLCVRLAHAAVERHQIALRVSLRHIAQRLLDGLTFAEAIADQVISLPLADKVGRAAIADRLELLLADGLDECGSHVDLVAERILEWVRAHDGCCVVVTTRPLAVDAAHLPGFLTAELRGLHFEESRQLAYDLLQFTETNDADAWRRLDQVLPRSHWRVGSRLDTAVRNPLLLSFLVVLAAEGVELLGTRATVYARVLDAVRERGRTDRVTKSDPSEATGRFVFDALGWHSLRAATADIATLRRRIAPELAAAAVLPMLAAENAFDEAVEFWRARGLLDRVSGNGLDNIIFVHQSLAEFGAASRVAGFSIPELREWLSEAQNDVAAADVIIFAAGAGRANDIAAVLLTRDRGRFTDEPLLAARALAEAAVPDDKLIAATIAELAERVASLIPLIAIEAGLALQRLTVVAPGAVTAAMEPLVESNQEWTRLAALTTMLTAAPDSVAPEVAEQWLHDLQLIKRISFGNDWAKDRDLPYTAADLQHAALPAAVQVVAERSSREKAHATFERLMSGGLGDLDTREEIGEILRQHGFADVEERHRPDTSSTLRNVLAWLERDRPHEIEFLHEIAIALDLPIGNAGAVIDGLPNLTRMVRVLEIDSFERLMASDAREVLRSVLRGIAAATRVDENDLARELVVARERIASGDARSIYDTLGEYDEPPAWERGAATIVSPLILIRGLTHSSDAVRLAAANLLAADNKLSEDELFDGLREALAPGYSTTLNLIAQIALEKLHPDRAVGLFVDRLAGRSTRGCSYLYEALGKLNERCSDDSQRKIRETLR